MTEQNEWQTDPSESAYDPAPHGDGATVLAGDHHDDDGEAFDSLVEPADRDDDDKPVQADAPLVPTEPSRLAGPPPLTRLRTETTTIPTNGTPYRIVPRNPNRKSLQIRFYGSGGNIDVRIADDQSKVGMRMGAFTLSPNVFATNAYQSLDLNEHTGPVYCASTSEIPDNTLMLSVIEVTA